MDGRGSPPLDRDEEAAAAGRALLDDPGRADAARRPPPEGGAAVVVDRETERLRAALESMAVGCMTIDTGWTITYANTQAGTTVGVDREQLVGRSLWRAVPALLGSVFEDGCRRAVATGQVVAVEGRSPGQRDRWVELRAAPEPDGLTLCFLDITDRHEAHVEAVGARRAAEDAAARLELLGAVSALLSDTPAEARLGAALPLDARQLAHLLVPTLADWCTVTLAESSGIYRTVGWAHRQAALEVTLSAYAAVQAESLSADAAIAVAVRTGEEVIVPSAPPLARWIGREPARTLVQRLDAQSVGVFPLLSEGRAVGTLALVATTGRTPLTGTELITAREVARRVGLAVEAAHLHARTGLVAAVVEQLSATLDAEDAVARLAQLVVPTLADWCIVSLLDDDEHAGSSRGLRDVGWWHVDEDARESVRDYASCRLEALDETSYLLRTLATGRPQAVEAGATEAISRGLRAERPRALLAELAPESVIVLPLRGRGRTVGLISLFNGPSRSPITPEELATARDVADRAGLALDSSRQYRQQRDLAGALQRALLTEPPEPEHGRVVVRYVAAAEAARVGGDWYDAFVQRGGATVLVIGDVVGHDTDAAAAMGQVRSIVRTLGVDDGDAPASVLRRTDAVMEALSTGTTATALVARLEQSEEEARRGAARLRWSSAGHPPAMVVSADGSVTSLAVDDADLILGVLPDIERTEHVTELQGAAAVFLYTDGLVERRGQSLEEGLERLRGVLAELAATDVDLDGLVDGALARLLPEEPEDDVAVIAVRLHDRSAGARPPHDRRTTRWLPAAARGRALP